MNESVIRMILRQYMLVIFLYAAQTWFRFDTYMCQKIIFYFFRLSFFFLKSVNSRCVNYTIKPSQNTVFLSLLSLLVFVAVLADFKNVHTACPCYLLVWDKIY